MNSPINTTPPSQQVQRMQRWLLRGVAAAVLALAFLAYLNPAFVFDLANRITLCF